jgi:hypothetical protein
MPVWKKSDRHVFLTFFLRLRSSHTFPHHLIMDQLLELATKAGMDPAQGQAASGGLLSLLKSTMAGQDFDKIATAIPGAETAVAEHDTAAAAAPATVGGMAGIMGAAMSTFGGSQGTSMAGLLTMLQSKGVDPGMMNKFMTSVAPMIQQQCGVDIIKTLGLPSASADTNTTTAAAGEAAPAASNPMASLSGMAKGFGF